MKALDAIPLLTPEVLDKIEAVVQSRPKRTESYRWSGTACRMSARGGDSAFIWSEFRPCYLTSVWYHGTICMLLCILGVQSWCCVPNISHVVTNSSLSLCVFCISRWHLFRFLVFRPACIVKFVEDPSFNKKNYWGPWMIWSYWFCCKISILCCVSYVLLVVGISSPVLWTDKPVTIGVLGNVAFGLLFKSAIAFVHSRGRFRGTIGHRDPPWTTSKVSYQQQPRSSFQGACKWRFPLDILSPSVVGIRDRNNLHIHSDTNMNMKQVE